MAALVVLFNPDLRALRHTEERLSERGYLVAISSSFGETRELLNSTWPDLLIADLDLEPSAAAQLATESRLAHPDVPVILTFSGGNAVAEAEAQRYHEAFVAVPLGSPDLLGHVRMSVAKRRGVLAPIRRWCRSHVEGVEVNAADARAQIIDVSYGGVRLAFSEPTPIPTTFALILPSDGLELKVQRIWTGRCAPDDQLCCGAQLAELPADPWRKFVDAFSHRVAS